MRASRESIICNLWSCHFDGVGAITSANSKKGLCDWSFIAEHSDSKSFFLFHKGNSDLGPNVQPQFFGPTKLFDPKILFPRWPFLPPPKINVQCVHQKKKKGFSLQFSSLCILHPYSSLETKIELFGNSNCYDFLLFFFFFFEKTHVYIKLFFSKPQTSCFPSNTVSLGPKIIFIFVVNEKFHESKRAFLCDISILRRGGELSFDFSWLWFTETWQNWGEKKLSVSVHWPSLFQGI